MLNSVRLRLTIWYVGVLSLVLIGFSIGVYTLLAQNIRAEADRQLTAAIDVMVRSLRHEVEEHEGKIDGEKSFRDVVSTVYRDSFAGVGMAVYEDRRRVAEKPGPGGAFPEPLPTVSPEPIFERVVSHGEPWRTASQVVHVKDAGSYQFVSAAPLAPVETDLTSIRRIFFLAVPLALAAAALGGFLLARKSLAPVVEMSETADRISSRDLSQRVTVTNPRDELGRLGSTFNRLLARLEGSFNRQRQFMEDSSHELRTPIYVAHTAAQVTLERKRTEEEYREALGTIDQQLRRMQHIVDDMSVLARADAGAYPLKITQFDLGETVVECMRAAAVLSHRKGVKVSSLPLQELPCQGDEGLIRQMIIILLDNAIKYSPEGGRVSLAIDAPDHQTYTITVRDTGPGIPEHAKEKIFERFYRIDKARSRAHDQSGGTGLGLAIAKWIVGVHGGTLKLLKSGPDGTAFQAVIQRVQLEALHQQSV